MPKAKKAVIDGKIVTNKRDEILGVINELEEEYRGFVDFYDGNVDQMNNSTNTFMQEIIASELAKGEEDGDTAIRQAIGLLREYAETLNGS